MSNAIDHWVDISCLAVWLGLVIASTVLFGFDIILGTPTEEAE